MAIYKVVEDGDEILREQAVPVAKFGKNIAKLLDNMAETMYAYKGCGLAAPQIGVSKRVIVLDVGEGLVELINPRIIKAEGTQTDSEGCLSFPDLVGEVTRANQVTVQGQDRHGEPVEIEAECFFARALQHEIDHLNGVLFVDKVSNLRKVQ